MQRRTGGPFSCLLASGSPVPADHFRYPKHMTQKQNPYRSPSGAAPMVLSGSCPTVLRSVLVAILGLASITCVSRLSTWLRDGWLAERWSLPHDFAMNLLACAGVGAILSIATMPFVVLCVRRVGWRRCVPVTYGLGCIVVVAFELFKPYTRIEPPIAAAIGAAAVSIIASFLWYTGKSRDTDLHRSQP